MKIYEFSYAFQITRKIIFGVNYYTVGGNDHPYFSTQANEFNQPKTDWSRCGQAQDELLKGKARTFWKKWDYLHCKVIDDKSKFKELIEDIEDLKNTYNFIEYIADDHVRNISFNEMKALSMQDVHKK